MISSHSTSSSSTPPPGHITASKIIFSRAAAWAARQRFTCLERGVRVTGTDAWSWDAPFAYTAQEFAKNGDPSIIWEGHRAGMEIGYCHIEKLSNLEDLPGNGFEISCFPWKIKGASAGFTRAVAIFND